ncbi:MAG: hypothetical protein KGL10_03680 [Alphaproteobacteria bacterium]|nr:hypothetical protein [Alphaproteobacteria bacterium]MDE2336391.1 hypothetical protein [Alphaproteobacteria bacterium]
MTSPDSQERLKTEAKNIQTRISVLIKDRDPQARMLRALCIYAGLLTETLLEYEEPDVIMEQAFHRIADLLRTDPADNAEPDALMPFATVVDHDTELGRLLARATADKLPKGLDDLHEIAIALIINDVPLWEKDGFARDRMLRMMVECVIASLTFEMATQDFCDFLVEEFMTDNAHSTAEALVGLGAVAGYYFQDAQRQAKLPEGMDRELMNVMVREALSHGTPGTKNWGALAAANDVDDKKIPYYLKEIKPAVEEFFVLIGLDEPLGRAVAVAKAVGRMVAVISVEDVGQIHPSIAKSLAKTGMILGTHYKEHVIPA